MRNSQCGSAGSKLLIVLFLIAAVIVAIATRVPQEATEELQDITEENAMNCELKFKTLALRGEGGKEFTAELTAAELNSIVSKDCWVTGGFEEVKKYTRQGSISVDDVRVNMASDKIFLTFKTYVKFKYFYVRLAGELKTKDGEVVMLAKKVYIGKLPVPTPAASLAAGIVRSGKKPLTLDVPDYVKSVEIKEDKLLITVGE